MAPRRSFGLASGLLAVCLTLSGQPPTWWQKNAEAERLVGEGELRQARTLMEAAAEQLEQTRANPPALSAILNNLCQVHRLTGSHDKAEACCRRSLRIKEEVFGTEHPMLVTPLVNLAQVYLETGWPSKAEDALKRSLQIQNASETDPRERQAVFTALANLNQTQGRYEEAEKYYRILESGARARGVDPDPDTAVTLCHLSLLYRRTGRAPEGLATAQDALAALGEALDPGHPGRAFCMTVLGVLQLDLKKPEEAEATLLQALRLSEKARGPAHPLTADILTCRAAALRKLGRKKEAKQVERRAKEVLSNCRLCGQSAFVLDARAAASANNR